MSKQNTPGGKGDAPRQGQDRQKYAENWEKIFGKNKEPQKETK